MSKRLWDKLDFQGKVLLAMSAVVNSILFVIAIISYNYQKNLLENKWKRN